MQALLAQTVSPREIIVVDNASHDDSLEIIRRYPQVRLLALHENTGFARGNNLAMAAAGNVEWLALVNPDAFVAPDWLEILLQAGYRYPEVAAFSSRLLNAAEPSRLDGDGDAYHCSGLVWRLGHSQLVSAFAHTRGSLPVKGRFFSPCAAAALYRAEAVRTLKGFDEDYFCYVEDVDLGFRLRLAGYGCLHVTQAVAHHVGSGTTGSQHSDFALYHGHRNLVWTFIKNMPGLLFWLLLPLHVVMNLFSIVWFSLRGHGQVILRAKRDALLGLPLMWQKRIHIQRDRKATLTQIASNLSLTGRFRR